MKPSECAKSNPNFSVDLVLSICFPAFVAGSRRGGYERFRVREAFYKKLAEITGDPFLMEWDDNHTAEERIALLEQAEKELGAAGEVCNEQGPDPTTELAGAGPADAQGSGMDEGSHDHVPDVGRGAEERGATDERGR